MDVASELIDRPAARSADFSYRPSGDIIPNTGYRKQGGHPDPMAYAQIRFPLEKAPAFVHSQSYRQARQDGSSPTAYPWRDNFCEVTQLRSLAVRRRLWPPGRGHPRR